MKFVIQNRFITNLLLICACASLSHLCACRDKQEDALNQLNSEVMKLHNETMSKIGDMYELKKALKKRSDATSEDSTQLKEALLEAQLSLSKADDNMMQWMHNYTEGKSIARPFEDKIKFFKSQKDSIQMVNNQIYMSIAVASKYVKL
ncbi:MAG: hypothetical protein RIS64_1117 [Bacteroidota bacterium]|jgi:hypothetical protein